LTSASNIGPTLAYNLGGEGNEITNKKGGKVKQIYPF